MKNASKKLCVTALLCVGLAAAMPTAIIAQADSINIVSTAVPFLRISPDARAGGMGDAAIATNPDANSPFWNLAKTAFAEKRSAISLNYTPWLRDLGLNDVYLASAAAYKKIDDNSVISGSMRFFSLGNIQLTDFSGNVLNTVRPTEFSIDGGYTRVLSEKLSLAVALRYINSRLVVGDVGTGVVYKAGNALAGDVSLFYNGRDVDGQGLNFGVVLSNLGTKVGYTNDARNKDFLPANLGLGMAYTKVMSEGNSISFALDVNKLLVPVAPTTTGVFATDSANLSEYRNTSVVSSWMKSFSDGSSLTKSFQVSAGMEYSYNNQFKLRAGYFYEDRTRGNRRYFTAGAGFDVKFMQINVSYLVPSGSGVTRNPLSNTLRLGLVFNLSNDDF
ncbi:type IX secretion system outer membrane channel protein PorV [Sediminibacterium sp.]|uniref:type IX secretion system outer membrane channel protein PorV n=1 Tax=Sediminibacterium sp. TaxID=1917865 RepID=UPI002735DF51|nr:type IX secretion system outer membrane channel protein PorV [Sediminibacterium sp.]MDP3392161.1 type IX secretion system outer membrane channel protein PorV [Sediminibacterium sp.]MDP3567037.1 type IX secretion system outer membrane channel protein PorV [Sediminibacterium sp.]